MEQILALSTKNTDAFLPFDQTMSLLEISSMDRFNPNKYSYSLEIVHNSKRLETNKCPAIREYLKKLGYICIMEYYDVVKRERRGGGEGESHVYAMGTELSGKKEKGVKK